MNRRLKAAMLAAVSLLLGGCLFTRPSPPPAHDMARAPATTAEDPPDAPAQLTALERLEQLLRDNARLQADADRAQRQLATERKRNATLSTQLRALGTARDRLAEQLARTQQALEQLQAEHRRTLQTLLTERLARVRLEQTLVQRQLEALSSRRKEGSAP